MVEKTVRVINGKINSSVLPDSIKTNDLKNISISYNSDKTVSSITENGITTNFTYNSDGTVNTESRLGITGTWSYDTSGYPVSFVTASGGSDQLMRIDSGIIGTNRIG